MRPLRRRGSWKSAPGLLLLLVACHVGPCRPPPPPAETYEPVAPNSLTTIEPATTLPTESHWRPERERIVLIPLPSEAHDGGASAAPRPDAGVDAGRLAEVEDDFEEDEVDAGARCPRDGHFACTADCWCRDVSGLTTSDLVSVHGEGGEVWAVGQAVLRRTQGQWSNQTLGLSPTEQPGLFVPTRAGPLRTASAVWSEGGERWFTTGARIRHLVGEQWDTTNALGTHPNDLTALWGSSSRSIWAVGRGGTALHFDGAGWTQVDLGTTEWLTSVAGAGSEVWIAGTSGTVLLQSGSTWARVPAGEASGEWFTAIQAPAPGYAWVSSNSGRIYRATARGLTVEPGDAGGPIFGMWFAGPSEGWAVGYHGLVMHFDGKRWTRMESGVAADLLAVHGDGARVWAVGRTGALLFHPR